MCSSLINCFCVVNENGSADILLVLNRQELRTIQR